jgi:hypothetical protein
MPAAAKAKKPPPPPTPAEAARARVRALLQAEPGPLYAVLDAARDFWIPVHLEEHAPDRVSLYSGDAAVELANVAPYLVRIDPDSTLLPVVIDEGWGESWGVFLTSPAPIAEVRSHLRKFLMVELEDGGEGRPEEAYFRWYDPRVLRVFLPTCTPAEAAEFFGPVGAFLCEAKGGDALLRFAAAADRPVQTASVAVGPAAARGG